MPPKPLLFSDVTRRLAKLDYKLVPGPVEGLRTFAKNVPPYFPYVIPRNIAFPVPYDDDEMLPAEVVENIVLHLFLTGDEDDKFWADDEPVN